MKNRNGKPGCPRHLASVSVCDEYPYAATMQGGPANYDLGLVSLQSTPRHEGSPQGSYISAFYRREKLVQRSTMGIFLNTALPLPTSFIDRTGQWQKLKYNRRGG